MVAPERRLLEERILPRYPAHLLRRESDCRLEPEQVASHHPKFEADSSERSRRKDSPGLFPSIKEISYDA
jgi:hypothetical protein